MGILDILRSLLEGARTTGEVAVGAWVLGLAVGIVFAGVRSLRPRIVAWPADFVNTTLRSMPQLVVLYVIYFGVSNYGISIAAIPAAIVGLGLVEAAYMAEYYRAGTMTVPESQRDAARSLGLRKKTITVRIVWPQVLPFMYPPALNSLIGLLKNATLASALGAPEILYRAQSLYGRTGQILETLLVLIALYMVVTIPMAQVVSLLERRAEAYRVVEH